jgi:FAD:protein FMN transferase
VSVLAPTAMAADAASTAAFVLGPTDGPAFLAEEGLAALVVHRDGTAIPVGDWPR